MSPAPAPDPVPLQLSAEQVAQWWSRITLARAVRQQRSVQWKRLLARYLPPTEGSAESDVSSNIHFRNAHLKIAELWAQMPEWQLTPLEPLYDLRDPETQQPFVDAQGKPLDPAATAAHVVAVKRAVLNHFLGPDHADADHAVIEALFNILATAGIGPVKVHYQCDLQPTQMMVPGPPAPNVGDVIGMSPVPGPPVEQTIEVPVYERFRMDAFSAEKLLIPHDWRSTQYDAAPWLGEEFVMGWEDAKRLYKLDDTFRANTSRDELVLTTDAESTASGAKDLFRGVRIWLHAARFDPTVAHSELFYLLVLAEGINDKPVEYRRSPYQTLGQDGRLTADSMIGNPIHPIVLRILPDHAYVPADAAFTDPLVRVENTWMQQDIKARDANIPRFGHSDAIKESIDKLADADVGMGVGIPDELMMRGIDKLIVPIPHLEHAQSDAAGRAGIQRAIQETLGIGANQAGSVTSKVHSATENAIVEANVSKRLKGEQVRLMKSVCGLIRKFDSLIQRYADQRAYVEIVGQNGERRLAMWDQDLIAGRYAYDATPESQLAQDPEQRIKRTLDYVNFLAKSPYTNQAEMHRIVDLAFGFDPSRMMQTPEPPPPDKPSIGFTFNGSDLAIPEVRLILGTSGIQLPPVPSPEAVQAHQVEAQKLAAKQQPHGGLADQSEKLSKHASEETGELTGPKTAGARPQAPTVQ